MIKYQCIFCGETKCEKGIKRTKCIHYFYRSWFDTFLLFRVGLIDVECNLDKTVIFRTDYLSKEIILAITKQDIENDPQKYYKKIQTFITFS